MPCKSKEWHTTHSENKQTMATIKEDYCSKEVYRLLIEKGFDGEIHTTFDEEGYTQPSITLQMAMKWLRKVYKIDISVYPYGDYSSDNYQFDVYENRDLMVSKDDGYMTYEQACESAIKYCLKHLI